MIFMLWLAGIILCWLPFAIALVRSLNRGVGWSNIPEPEDYIFGTFFGFFMALVWPVTLVFFGVSRLVKRAVDAEQRATR